MKSKPCLRYNNNHSPSKFLIIYFFIPYPVPYFLFLFLILYSLFLILYFHPMFSTVIFDMDGLLIDSEPLWQEAGGRLLQQYGIALTNEQYHSTTGLRTPEWIDYWFGVFKVDQQYKTSASAFIEKTALEIIQEKGKPMPGVRKRAR